MAYKYLVEHGIIAPIGGARTTDVEAPDYRPKNMFLADANRCAILNNSQVSSLATTMPSLPTLNSQVIRLN